MIVEPRGHARRAELDGVRGIAIAVVVVSHAASGTDIGRFHLAGAVGVTLFFVLSGYLITSLLLAEHQRSGRISVRDFYLRRARRLFPALAAMLAVVAPAMLLAGVPGWALASIPLYVENWVQAQGTILAPIGHIWSLSVEEQFYLVWPPALVIALRWRRGGVGLAAAASAASVIATLVLLHAGSPVGRLYYGSDTHAVSLLLGCLLAFGLQGGRLPHVDSAASVVGAAVLLCASFALHRDSAWIEVGVMWAASIASALLVWASCGTSSALLRTPVLTWLGRRSYALYLWHLPVVLLVAEGVSSSLPAVLVAVGLSLAIAELSWWGVESPFGAGRRALRLTTHQDHQALAAETG